ncbi:hypothetical protein LJPFL01_0226 [Lelliottia jeotgali]|nr:hypothetical protein LJPFL01_0226 [Lelliottia jeotgali]
MLFLNYIQNELLARKIEENCHVINEQNADSEAASQAVIAKVSFYWLIFLPAQT